MDCGDHDEQRKALLAYLESEKFSAASKSSTRLVAKLRAAVQAEELYETQQILRTVYFRFSNHKEKVPALVDLLYFGSMYLVEKQEMVSGQDIGSLLLEVSANHLSQLQTERRSPQDQPAIQADPMCSGVNIESLELNLCEMIANIAVGLPDTEVGQTKFVAEALRLLSPKLSNKELLHYTMAKNFCRHKDLVNARYHYLHCASQENAEDIASMLIDYHSRGGTKSEVDLFISQFILQYLCLQQPCDNHPSGSAPNPSVSRRSQSALSKAITTSRKTRRTIRSTAQDILNHYASRHPLLSNFSVGNSTSPLLNFLYFIISIIESNQPETTTYKVLCDIYKTAWTRDPNYQNYLNRIGAIYFGLVDPAKQQQNQGGFFNNILMSLLDGGDDDEEDDEDQDEDPHHGGNTFSCDDLD